MRRRYEPRITFHLTILTGHQYVLQFCLGLPLFCSFVPFFASYPRVSYALLQCKSHATHEFLICTAPAKCGLLSVFSLFFPFPFLCFFFFSNATTASTRQPSIAKIVNLGRGTHMPVTALASPGCKTSFPFIAQYPFPSA